MSKGFIKRSFVIPLGNKLSFEAELLAVIYAFEAAQHYSWDRLQLECDFMYLVQLLSSGLLDVPWFFRARRASYFSFLSVFCSLSNTSTEKGTWWQISYLSMF